MDSVVKTSLVQVPAIYRRRVGDIVVTALSDGYSPSLISRLRNIDTPDAEAMLASAFRSPVPRVSVNVYAIHSAGRIALVDTGSGNSMGPTLGHLQANMVHAGIDPKSIDTVLLTHMHPDHSNGLSDDDGNILFPKAEVVVHEKEVAHWTNDAHMATATERAREKYFIAGRRQLEIYRKQLRTFSKGEVFPGVTAVPIPGHTPGHTAYLVSSGNDSLLIWGDIVHHPDIQIPRPEVGMEFDSDINAAIDTRKRVFDMAATDRVLVSGMHLHFPGFAHLHKDGPGYALHPEGWEYSF
jgi:glyoxylase-like metal-dependent hydrolase (beta-lactamase superfamily II)